MNPVSQLNETVQALYGKNIETRVINKEGDDHAPTITVKIVLPNGHTYKAKGANKRIAKRNAAAYALEQEDLL